MGRWRRGGREGGVRCFGVVQWKIVCLSYCFAFPLTLWSIPPSLPLSPSFRQGTFWGDLNHIETRFVYHQLLPRHLLQDSQAHPDALAVEDLARLASMARHAARMYARERSSLPLRLAAGTFPCMFSCLLFPPPLLLFSFTYPSTLPPSLPPLPRSL